MRTWTDTIDPATIPDDVLRSEKARRDSHRRTIHTGGRNGGRPPKQYKCRRCGEEITGAAAIAAHIPCTK